MAHTATPTAFKVASSGIDEAGAYAYLKSIGAEDWKFLEIPGRSDLDRLIEMMGRLCYKSFGADLNANITRVREDPGEYIKNILASGHGSVLEHGSVTFMFSDVSRVFTHELVRHRAGTAMSQESLRYVRLTDLGQWLPPELAENPKVLALAKEIFETAEQAQLDMADLLGLDDMPFDKKKKVTSAMRRLAPIGLATSIGFTANIRAWRHILEMRSNRHAEVEMRMVMEQVGLKLMEDYPLLFGDYKTEEIDGYLEFTTDYGKV